MNRKLFKLPFKREGFTNWRCPTCGYGKLRVKEDTFCYKETKESKKYDSHDGWEPDWTSYVYSCLLVCSNSACKDTVSSAGIGSVELDVVYDQDGMPGQEYDNFFQPKYFSPHLKIFLIPDNAPEDVKREIETSFSVFFCDPPSAANHIRVALEYLLTHLKVKRYVRRNGKQTYLGLHTRIEQLPKKYHDIQDYFFAVKWLGNAGSHSEKNITLDDVLDSYELMDKLLNEVFVRKEKNVKKLAKKIIKEKGPKKS